jgi:hypothetical protein
MCLCNTCPSELFGNSPKDKNKQFKNKKSQKLKNNKKVKKTKELTKADKLNEIDKIIDEFHSRFNF